MGIHTKRIGRRGRISVLILVLLAAGLVVAAPASAKPLDKGHFDETEPAITFDCDGIPVEQVVHATGNFLLNLRGSSPFPYSRESVKSTTTWTNLDTGGTFTEILTANRTDHAIVDNGDGTITITQFAAGGGRYYDQNGKLVLKDPGSIRFAFDINYNGTPGNPDDDKDVANSFRTIRESTGRTDTNGRDFCADIAEFTT